MKNRTEFDRGVPEALAKNSGYKCSFPSCGALTVGPSQESELKPSSTGMACHIIAASGGPGARRVIPGTPDSTISGIGNGVWLCYKHGKIVDTDEVTYTVDMLRTWRKLSELRAQLSHELGRDVDLDFKNSTDIYLPRDQINFSGLGCESEMIGDALKYSCIHSIWGDSVAHATRDFIVEVTRNALSHGGATSVEVRIEPESILIIDNGHKFDATTLSNARSISGGAESIKQLRGIFNNNVIVTFESDSFNNFHRVSLVRSIDDFEKFAPCVLKVQREHIWAAKFPTVVFDDCDTIYILLPEYFALSDVLRLPQMIDSAMPANRNYILIARGVSERAIKLMSEGLPRARFIIIPL